MNMKNDVSIFCATTVIWRTLHSIESFRNVGENRCTAKCCGSFMAILGVKHRINHPFISNFQQRNWLYLPLFMLMLVLPIFVMHIARKERDRIVTVGQSIWMQNSIMKKNQWFLSNVVPLPKKYLIISYSVPTPKLRSREWDLWSKWLSIQKTFLPQLFMIEIFLLLNMQ